LNTGMILIRGLKADHTSSSMQGYQKDDKLIELNERLRRLSNMKGSRECITLK